MTRLTNKVIDKETNEQNNAQRKYRVQAGFEQRTLSF